MMSEIATLALVISLSIMIILAMSFLICLGLIITGSV